VRRFTVGLKVDDELCHLQKNFKRGQFVAQRRQDNQQGGHALLEKNRQNRQAGLRLQSKSGRKGLIQFAGGNLGGLDGADHLSGGAVGAIHNHALEAIALDQSAAAPAHGLRTAQDQQSAARCEGGGGGDERVQSFRLRGGGGNGQGAVANFHQIAGGGLERGGERVIYDGGRFGNFGGDAARNLRCHLLGAGVEQFLDGGGGDLPVAFFVGHGCFQSPHKKRQALIID
jgi:hypothetical protein